MTLRAINDKKNVGAVFLDISKAFDSVNHLLLLRKLKNIGISERSVQLMSSYLTKRTQCVRALNAYSNFKEVKYGVPQGSILGPLLFIIYINDLFSVHLRGNIITYADDTCLVVTAPNNTDLYSHMKKDLFNICKWMVSNSLAINVNKTKYIIFDLQTHVGKFGPPTEDEHRIKNIKLHNFNTPEDCTNDTCNCTEIDKVTSIKYLGVIIDERLDFKLHIGSVVRKVRWGLYILSRLRTVAEPKLLKVLYYAFVQSHLQYAIIVWGGIYNNTINRIHLQKRAIRIVSRTRDFLAHTSPFLNANVFCR